MTDLKLSRFPPLSIKRYQVVSYDVCDEPAGNAYMRLQGEFDLREEALACAQAVIDRDLENYASEGSAEAIYDQYGSFGEGAMIFGEPTVDFHCYEYARKRADALFARRAVVPSSSRE